MAKLVKNSEKSALGSCCVANETNDGSHNLSSFTKPSNSAANKSYSRFRLSWYKDTRYSYFNCPLYCQQIYAKAQIKMNFLIQLKFHPLPRKHPNWPTCNLSSVRLGNIEKNNKLESWEFLKIYHFLFRFWECKLLQIQIISDKLRTEEYLN